MRAIHVPQDTLEWIVAKWAPDTKPLSEFRLPLCASCGRKIRGRMFHCWLADRVREIHLCRRCGPKFDER